MSSRTNPNVTTQSGSASERTGQSSPSELLADLTFEPPYRRMRVHFVLAVTFQLLLLTGLAGVHAYTLATGRTVTLRTVPVDPRDPLRGDYVHLGYEISSVKSEKKLSPDEEVYVILRQGNPYWEAVKVSETPVTLSPCEVAIKAKVETEDWQKPTQSLHSYHLHYGIEQAFVPEGAGRNLEREKHLVVQVAVDRFGNAVVKNVVKERIPGQIKG